MNEKMPTELPPPGDARTLYVVDVSGYVFRAYHALPPLSNSKGEPTHAVYGVTTMLLKLLATRKPVYFAVAMDSKKPSFRAEVYEAYKANRPPPPPDLSQQMERVRQVIGALGMACFQREGVEADDWIAAVVKKARAENLRTVIVSADKDLLQLVSDDVSMYDGMRDKAFGIAETEEKMGVPPHQVRDLLALTGDSSDNVPGVPSVGPKTATALLKEYGSLDGIYANLETLSKAGLKQKLKEHRAEAYLSYDLVGLKDDLDPNLDIQSLRYAGVNPEALHTLFVELEFSRLLAELTRTADKTVTVDVNILQNQKAIQGYVEELQKKKTTLALFPLALGHDLLQCQWLGLGLQCKGEAPFYVPLHHTEQSETQITEAAVLSWLKPVLEDVSILKITADLKTLAHAMDEHKISLANVTLDTMLASYLLEPEKRAHALGDLAQSALQTELPKLDLTPQLPLKEGAQLAAAALDALFKLQERLEPELKASKLDVLLAQVEIPLVSVLSNMERTGIRLDSAMLLELNKQATAKMSELEQACYELAGHTFNVASPRQLETILFDELKLPAMKRTKTARSTDQEVLEELAVLHALPRTIVEHRKLAKLKSTYLDALPRAVRAATGRIHTSFNQVIAATGRLSSHDPNLQNIPIRDEFGRAIRKAFIPQQGWDMLSADYSQIELRLLAELSGDVALVEAFQEDVDVHVRTAQALFGVAADQVSREMRGRAKTVNFAVIYGQTEFALGRNLQIERKEAARYIEAFFKRYAGVRAFLDNTVEQAKKHGYVVTLLGRRRTLPDINSNNRNLRMQAERMAFNTPIQGSAADILKVAMIRIHDALHTQNLKSHMLLTVHDELVFEVPPEERSAMQTLVSQHMENAASLRVPIKIDMGWGPSWGHAHG